MSIFQDCEGGEQLAAILFALLLWLSHTSLLNKESTEPRANLHRSQWIDRLAPSQLSLISPRLCAGHRPSNPAFWWVGGTGKEIKWSFEELGKHSRQAANVLESACGLQPGDRVMVVLPRLPEWWLVSVACMRAGVIMIPGVSQLTEKDLKYRLQASGAKSIITSDALVPQVDAISSDCPSLQTKLLVSDGGRPGWMNFRELQREASSEHNCVRTKSQDPLSIYFTSGTTGNPKMVEHSHSSYGLGFVASGRRWAALTESSIFWNTTDTGWVKAAWTFFSAWSNGSCIFVHELPQVDAKLILNTLSRFPVTSLCCVPTLFRLLVQEDLTRYQFPSLRHCLTGGEALNPDVRERWKSQTGLELHEGYGQSETVVICANQKGMTIKSGSMGKAFPPYDVQIVDNQGKVLPPGEEGNVAVHIKPTRPFCFFRCYVDNPEKTAASEQGDFYITGDRACMDKDGYFWFLGRSDDVINSSSYRIGPVEVESALAEHPAVLESAVVSSPDPIRGEVVKAFVVLTSAYSSQEPEALTRELQEHVKKTTAPYKYPRKVEFISELPKTVSGKIQRSKLRNQEWGK
ncbi:acyl-coenzyme A synthetase ACSM5, mitochondrial isoform X2 [Perognathus longimembris pacificus]|uniref:acyl-coenzyme A synthetase ACSM5, mitochondrial isoform X2 n=1 Tax=Perognathus longimembris pacificus TaxID=214514 RepID=UPI0020187DB3|nr:acyl-coenzyme A synthetase ACSM5, mitochondrial isoform X2 [Perognathus longimembris pacificus]